MPWRLIAKSFGWREVVNDNDPAAPLIVWHPRRKRRFSGADAWKAAVRLSINAPVFPVASETKEARP